MANKLTELSWHDLARVVDEHEVHHNYHVLEAFCELYYPGATKITVQATQEYDDNDYYFTFGPSNITVWKGEQMLSLPDDDVSLLVLLAQSPELKQQLEKDEPENPVLWLADVYYEDVYNLELCGIEKGYDLRVDFGFPPPPPRQVYVKKGVHHALPADG